MIVLLGFWTHALAALLYGALALWQLRRWKEDGGNRRLVAAFAVTSAWAIFVAFQGPLSIGAGIAEAARNFAFLGFMYAIVSRAADERGEGGVKLVYTVVAAVIGLQLTLAGVTPQFAGHPALYAALASTLQVIGLTIAAGSLVLVHNLYGQAAHESRWGIRLPMIALAGLWAYDLHLYTVAWLTRAPVDDLYAMRGAILSMLVPLFALASRRSERWRMQLSRAATFQSLSLIAILGYLILMMTASRALEVVGGNWVRIGQVGLVFAITLAAVILLPSGRMRAWSRVLVAKHFFEHRYDYREEWLRFTRTVGGDAPLGERIIKAIADVAESPSGLLLVPEGGRLSVAARWNWREDLPEAAAGDAELIGFLERTAHVVDFSSLRSGMLRTAQADLRVPAPLADLDPLWAGVPLIHGDRLVGLVLLEHPPVRRPLDWEDFDLFRTVGIQAASYLAEARTQDALADARRFDEFNRRFAFIIHDIKNLVSQLSLVIRNAERHADKPEFREDMIATLHSSVRKMNDLLARLHRGNNNVEAEPVRAIPLGQAVATVAEVKRRVHPVEVEGDPTLPAVADPVRLEQALGHLVQNAIDASPAGAPVRIRCGARGSEAAIEIIDRGEGMTADFIRTRLFQPFASTKESGFGVGAFEARSLVAAMGGRIEVDSRPGAGSRFTVFLPLGETSLTERKIA
ncbi:MAG TPA: XrtA/PEP-CTERM system histidine kinase PrsK [Allosphingosinicella sp.]|nr:XrtA/PEP-CTERM system histidine kinase PrsK [Allosphingosinicella sp.]